MVAIDERVKESVEKFYDILLDSEPGPKPEHSDIIVSKIGKQSWLLKYQHRIRSYYSLFWITKSGDLYSRAYNHEEDDWELYMLE